MKKSIFFIAPLSILMLFSSCTKTLVTPFYETKWVLKRVFGKTVYVTNGTTPFVVFSKSSKNAAGKSPCNTFSGAYICDYTSEGTSFKMSSILASQVACGDNAQLETDFFNALGRADFVNIANNELHLILSISSNSEPLAVLTH